MAVSRTVTVASLPREESFLPDLRHRLQGIPGKLCWSSGTRLSSDVAEDCRQESALLLWQMRYKLQALPPDQRDAYAAVSVRRVLVRLVQAESEHAFRRVGLEEAELFPTDPSAASPEEAICFSNDLRHQVGTPALAAALGTLSASDCALLNLFYGQEMSDAAIARHLGCSTASVKMRRCRALVKLRRLLEAAGVCR